MLLPDLPLPAVVLHENMNRTPSIFPILGVLFLMLAAELVLSATIYRQSPTRRHRPKLDLVGSELLINRDSLPIHKRKRTIR
jgi:hypothetical protein